MSQSPPPDPGHYNPENDQVEQRHKDQRAGPVLIFKSSPEQNNRYDSHNNPHKYFKRIEYICVFGVHFLSLSDFECDTPQSQGIKEKIG